MDAVFLNLVNISITASYIAVAVIIFRFLLKKAPKAYTCILWLLVALRLFIPVTDSGLLSFASNFSLIPSSEVLPNSLIDKNASQFNVNFGINKIDMSINDYLGDRYAEGVTVPADMGSKLMTVLGMIWLIGCIGIILYAIGSYIHFRRKTKASVCVKGNTFICDYVSTPFILGIIRPRILLPSSFGEEESSYVVAHEKAHLKRLDHIWKPIGFMLLAIHWFNPVMWLSYILFCRDIELACDEYVIKNMNSDDKKAYSTALLNCSVPKKLISAYPLAFGEIGVKERIKTILKYKKPAVITSLIAIILCGVTAICFLSNPQKTNLKEQFYKNPVEKVYSISFDDGKKQGSISSDTDDELEKYFDELSQIQIGKTPIKNIKPNENYKVISIPYLPEREIITPSNKYDSLTYAYYFNAECTEVWICEFDDLWTNDDGIKNTTNIYKVYNPEKVLSLFERVLYKSNRPTRSYKRYRYINNLKDRITLTLHYDPNALRNLYEYDNDYHHWGLYDIEGNQLTLEDTYTRGNFYTFKIVENGIIFDAENSSPLTEYPASEDTTHIPDGAFFELINGD